MIENVLQVLIESNQTGVLHSTLSEILQSNLVQSCNTSQESGEASANKTRLFVLFIAWFVAFTHILISILGTYMCSDFWALAASSLEL